MSELIVVAFDEPNKADEVLNELRALQWKKFSTGSNSPRGRLSGTDAMGGSAKYLVSRMAVPLSSLKATGSSLR